MPYFSRLWHRDSRRRPPAPARYVLEALEERTMLSANPVSLAASQASISSMTVLQSSLNTAVAGSKITFTATVENSSTDAPITSGQVDFVVQSPQKIVLGDVTLNKQGQASVTTTDLTEIRNYQVEARYIPTNSTVSPSAAVPVTVGIVSVPLNVPTTTTLTTGATLAEAGQDIPLVATVTDAGTGDQIDAGKVEAITGSVAFLTDSPNPIVLGEVKLNSAGQASISATALQNAGPYQIIAEFLPANNYFAESTSAPVAVTITPTTVNAPTVTSLQAEPNSIETGEAITFTASVQNANSDIAQGTIELKTVARHPVVLSQVPVSSFGVPVTLTTAALQKVGTYQVEAVYIPGTNRFAESTSPPVAVSVTPLTVASFRVTPVVSHGRLGRPRSFQVIALNAKRQPVTNYTGTVVFTSPTGSWTLLKPSTYVTLGLPIPPANSPILATFNPQTYTFTTDNHGQQTFLNAVTFGKGGAETVKVTQANNPKVFGIGTFAIQ